MFRFFDQISILHYVYGLTFANSANNTVAFLMLKTAVSLSFINIINKSRHLLQTFG